MAAVAPTVEHRFCKPQVVSSNLTSGSMKLIVAGIRRDPQTEDWFDNYDEVKRAVEIALPFFGNPTIEEWVSGAAWGVDKLGERYAAKELGLKPHRFFPDYHSYGRMAPIIRNQEMVDYVGEDGALIAIWDGHSRGTRDIIERAQLAGLKVYVHRLQ